MRFYNKTTYNPPTWSRGTIRGSTNQLSEEAGGRPLFSDPTAEEGYDKRFDLRQAEYMNTPEVAATDKSVGGVDE